MRELLETALHGRYTIDRQLGQGGMGAVYLAEDQRLQRPVAIKLLPPEFAVREELRERFLRETRVTAAFSHPNIVPVFAVEEHADLLCFVMGFIDGETLAQRVRRAGPLNAVDAIRLLQEVAWALSYAHGRGVVHRDIKPDNILIERATGRALVTDFGIARTASTTTSATLTRVGEVVGTPQFMSPEQAAGEPLDGRSDVYSLGVVAFFAVTGKLPFDAGSATAIMAMHLTKAPPPVASLRPDLPPALSAAIDRCLEKDPANRFETGEALAAGLEPLRASRPEVAPALRLFQARATQAFRAILTILIIEVMFIAHPIGAGNADFMLPLVIGTAIVWGITAQMIGLARALIGAGFSFQDASVGLKAIIAEGNEARAQERSDPRLSRQITRRRRIIVLGGSYGGFAWYWVMAHMRIRTGPDTYTIKLPGAIVLLTSAIMIGLSMAMFMMNSARATAIDRVVAFLWRGPLGRLAFKLAARAARSGGVAPGASATTSSAHALIAGLPSARRRELRDVQTRIQQLEQSLAALAEQRRGFDEAIAQAGSATTGGDAATRARREELVADLARARDEVIARRAQLTGSLENVRLQLLRLKSGVGSGAEVVAELRAAEAVAGG